MCRAWSFAPLVAVARLRAASFDRLPRSAREELVAHLSSLTSAGMPKGTAPGRFLRKSAGEAQRRASPQGPSNPGGTEALRREPEPVGPAGAGPALRT